MTKNNKQDNLGMLSLKLKNWANSYFARILREQEAMEYRAIVNVNRKERALAIESTLSKLEMAGQEFINLVKQLPAEPVIPTVKSAEDEYLKALECYESVVKQIAKSWINTKALSKAYSALKPVDHNGSLPAPYGYACKFYLQAQLEEQAKYYKVALKEDADMADAIRARMLGLADMRDAITA